LENFGTPTEIKLNKGEPINIAFNGELREKQQKIVEKFIGTCNDSIFSDQYKNGGLISLQCGGGKTVIALNIICRLKVKTLVVVHKRFLMDQWKERILQFIPKAKVGIIQGPNVNVDDCDIVLGMLQSLSQKDYPRSTFDSFGCCIVDEAHHIGAEVFSRSLRKISSWYMLGLSATPKRKDGLSKVFEMYIGPYVYKDINSDRREVDINIINIKKTMLYQREIRNYMRKPNIPAMINKICEDNNRLLLIFKLIQYLTETDDKKQILVLSDRRNHLTQLYNIVTNNKTCSVGYYVGGMKELDLKKSEHQTLILGTYSMSSEGMDIPSLNTLILASPKSDIQQSVGRILRKKSDTMPSVYDINDGFSTFENQCKKRKAFYRKEEFDQYMIDVDLFETQINIEKIIDSKIKIPTKIKKKKAIKYESECIF
jgi:superfamily II DNA or RNA helicase